MTYFNSRELTAIVMLSSLWGVLNGLFAPIVFQVFRLPIFCDVIGFAALSLTSWWIRKPGVATAVGAIATVLSLMLNPSGVYFLGFTAASLFFDLLTSLLGYRRMFKHRFFTAATLVVISVLSAALAGLIIGTLIMTTQALTAWGGVATWIALHAAGGLAGGLIGGALLTALAVRNIPERTIEQVNKF